jgi:hypothetical protein
MVQEPLVALGSVASEDLELVLVVPRQVLEVATPAAEASRFAQQQEPVARRALRVRFARLPLEAFPMEA